MSTPTHYLPNLTSRDDYVDYLEGYSPIGILKATSDSRTPLKTYMLETARNGQSSRTLLESFPDSVNLVEIDEALFKVYDKKYQDNIIGLIEVFNKRYPAFYTFLKSPHSNSWVRHNIDNAPWLDRVWLSSHILSEIWDQTLKTTNANRYVRLGFEHEAKYEIDGEPTLGDRFGYFEEQKDDERLSVPDRRKSRVYITERLGILEQKKNSFADLYDPFHSLVQLQIPADNHGGHRLYYDGKATNLSDSFLEHRSKIINIIKVYRNLTEKAEEKLWLWSTPVEGGGFRIDGEPVFIQFEQELSEETFDKFITYGFQRRNSILKIGGYIHRRGNKKIHMSAIDKHLWQPFILEATTNHILMFLPRGTCGNTIHRMVTYVQRFISPKIMVWLGGESYQDAIITASKEA